MEHFLHPNDKKKTGEKKRKDDDDEEEELMTWGAAYVLSLNTYQPVNM